jgi:hypothetical protein
MYGAASIPEPTGIACAMNVFEGFFREVARHSYEVDRQEENMFTSIRRYKVRRGSAEELARRVQEASCP